MKKILILILVFSFNIFSHQIYKKTIDEINVKKFQIHNIELIQVSENELKKFEGVYRFGPSNDMKVYLKDSTLRAFLPGQPEYTLQPISENEFKLKGLEGYKMIFKLDDNQKVISVTSSQPNGDFSAEKISDEVEPPKQEKTIMLSADQLKKFEGEYEFAPGKDMKIYIKNGNLKALVNGQPEYTLLPISENEFILENLSGYKMIFEENEKREVTNVTSSQPNGDFRAEKKK